MYSIILDFLYYTYPEFIPLFEHSFIHVTHNGVGSCFFKVAEEFRKLHLLICYKAIVLHKY